MVKKFKKDILDFGTGAVTLGVSGAVVGGLQSASGVSLPGVGAGISTISGFAPIVGVGLGAGAALRGVRNLNKKKKRKY